MEQFCIFFFSIDYLPSYKKDKSIFEKQKYLFIIKEMLLNIIFFIILILLLNDCVHYKALEFMADFIVQT